MKNIFLGFFVIIWGSLSMAGEYKRVRDLEAQDGRNKMITRIKNMLKGDLPDGCELIKIRSAWEPGLGKNFQGFSNEFVLKMDGEEVVFRLPVVNSRDNEQSLISGSFGFDSMIDGIPHNSLSLTRFEYSNTELDLWDKLEEIWNGAMIKPVDDAAGYMGRKLMVIHYNSEGVVGGIEYTYKFKKVKNDVVTEHSVHKSCSRGALAYF